MNTIASTVQTQFANIDNRQIAYRKIGTGAPIILANRFRGTLDAWDPLFLDTLAENNTVIYFDYPGIGESEGELPTKMAEVAAEVIKLADYLGIDKFNMGGFSFSTFVAQYVTFLYQDRVLKTILIGGNPIGKNKVPLEPLFLELAPKPTYEVDDFVKIFFEPASEESTEAGIASTERIFKRLDQNKVPQSEEIINRYIAGMQDAAEDKLNLRQAYKSLKIPVLAISADHDISLAAENWFPLLKNAPSLQQIVINDTGHALHYQHPKLVVGYINTFLNN